MIVQQRMLDCVDKFHMTKYINAAANQMLIRANLYKLSIKSSDQNLKVVEENAFASSNPEPIYELHKVMH